MKRTLRLTETGKRELGPILAEMDKEPAIQRSASLSIEEIEKMGSEDREKLKNDVLEAIERAKTRVKKQ